MKKILIILFLLSTVSFAQQLKFTGSKISIGNGLFFSGSFIEATAGDTLYFNESVYMYEGKMYKVNETVDSTISSTTYACVEDTILMNKIGRFLYSGFITDTSKSYTAGSEICIDGGEAAEVACDYRIGESIDTVTIAFFPNDVRMTYGSNIKDSTLTYVTDALEDSSFTDDLRIPISSVRLPNSNAPAATLYLGGEVLAFPTNADATVYFEFQMPHARVDDSDINIHLHYALSDNGTNPDSVRWVLTYTWANIDAQFPTPTTANHTEYVSTYVDSTHYYDVIATITGTGKTLSSMLICSLTRDVSEDDYGGSVYMIEIDAHYLRRNYTSPQSLF